MGMPQAVGLGLLTAGLLGEDRVFVRSTPPAGLSLRPMPVPAGAGLALGGAL